MPPAASSLPPSVFRLLPSGPMTDPRSQTVFLRYWGSHFKSQRHVEVLAREFRPLVARCWRCVLVLERLPADASWLLPLTNLGVQIECLPRPRSNRDCVAVWRAWRLYRRVRPDVVVCDNIHSVPLLAAALARVPVRCWFKRNMGTHYEAMREPSLRERIAPAMRLSCTLATRIFAVSQAVKDELVSLGFPAEKIVVRHNPRRLIGLDRAPDRAVARQQWGYNDEHVVIGTVGHAVPVKGWDILLQAFARVAAADQRARLLLVGSYQAPWEQAHYLKLKEYLDAQSLGDRVQFTGHLTDIMPALRAMDIFVLPSRSEGFSVALIEALDASLPCVSSRVGIASEVIQPKVNGFLVERGQVDGLAEALLKLVQDDALRAKFAAHAVVPPCIPTLEDYAEQLARDYETLLSRCLRPL